MKDYSVLEGLDRNFIIELRCAYDRGYRHGRDDEICGRFKLDEKRKEVIKKEMENNEQL